MWILDFLQDRPQSVWISKQTSKEIILNIGAPMGCVLSQFTNDSVSSEPSVVMVKFSDDTTQGLIQNSDGLVYQGEVGWLVLENDLESNVSKTKQMVFDFYYHWWGSWSQNIHISWHNHFLWLNGTINH